MQHSLDKSRTATGSWPAIARLPDDTLYDIFMLLRSQICFPGESEDAPYDPLGPTTTAAQRRQAFRGACKPKKILPPWTLPIVLSHVCSRWRAFTLASPRLWDFVRITGTFQNRIMMNAFFERSMDCPLSILFTKRTSANHVPTTNVFDLIAVISEVAEISLRIAELGVVASQFDVRLTMRELESAPLPQIRKLWLDTGFERSSDRTPISILSVNPLSVRVLHARHVPIMWQPFEGLVRLELSAGAGTSLPSLLFTLKSSPHLEALLLSLPSNRDNAVSRSDGPIPLKRLKELLLSVDDVDGAAFAILEHISFPITVDIEFRFARPVPRSLCDRNDSLRQIASIIQCAWITVEPHVWIVLETDSPRISLEYPGTLWRPAWLPYGFDYSTRLCEGLIAIPLPSLVQLSIRIEHWEENAADAIDIMQFNALFSAVPSITELNLDVHPKYIYFFTSALSTPDPNDGVSGGAGVGNGAERPLRCPKLKHWALEWFAEEPSVDDFWRIERCCAARAEAGIPVEHLCTSAVPGLVLASLEKSVGLVSVLGEDL